MNQNEFVQKYVVFSDFFITRFNSLIIHIFLHFGIGYLNHTQPDGIAAISNILFLTLYRKREKKN